MFLYEQVCAMQERGKTVSAEVVMLGGITGHLYNARDTI